MDITLPASLSGDADITIKVDSTELATDTISSLLDQQDDGSWQTSQDETVATLCTTLGAGKHVVKVVDAGGSTLAQASFTIKGTATPTAAVNTGASIVMVPAIFSCASGGTISMVIVLPATIKPAATVEMTLDGTSLYSDTVSSGFVQQTDGTWLSSGTVNMSSFCAVGTGSHVLKLLDANKKVLAQTSYTAQP
jgi:hypothetical protein